MEKISKPAMSVFAIVLSVFLVFSMGLHLYFAHFFSNAWQSHPGLWTTFFLFGFFSTVFGFWVSRTQYHKVLSIVIWWGYIWLGFFFILAAFTFPFIFASLIWTDLSFYKLEWLLCLVLIGLYSLFRGLQFPSVIHEKIKSPHPELKGLKMVQITDLHMGQLQHKKAWLDRVVEVCNQQQADFIFLTGDLVEGSLQQVQPLLESLKFMKCKMGLIYTSGNHELIHGGVQWETVLHDMGWTVLHNSHGLYNFHGKKIQVAGVPDRMIKRFSPRYESHPEKALLTQQKVDYRILLAHEPSSVKDLKSIKPDLLLSGHTHAGQIFPFNFLVGLVQPVVSGWKSINSVAVFAHPGTGLWGPPMRLGSRNSIYVFEMI